MLGPALAAGAVGALLLAGATACASTSKSVSVSSGTTSSGAASTGASPSASASAGTGTASPTGATATSTQTLGTGGALPVTPSAQLTSAPADTKYTAFESAAHSADGRTLYLGIESQGGACGQYNVVLEQTGSSVSVGLVHLPAGGRICPMYVAHMLVTAKLSAPLDGRRVIDLANGQTIASAQIG